MASVVNAMPTRSRAPCGGATACSSANCRPSALVGAKSLLGGDKRDKAVVLPVIDFLISWQLYLSKSPLANADTNYRFVEDCRADFSF